MADLPTFNDFMEIGIQAITSVPGTRLTEDAARVPGSDLNIVLAMAALMAERCAQEAASRQIAATLDGAQGAELDVLGFDLPYSLPRRSAAPSVLTVSLARPAATAGAGTIPSQTRFKLGGIPFRLLLNAEFAAAALSVSVYAQAEVTGPTGNVSNGTVGVFTDAIFDSTIIPTASTDGAGGTDTESDASYRERLRQAPSAARRGTLAAIEFGARTVPGVAFATATDRLNPDGSYTGIVDLVIADENGNSNDALEYLVGLVMREYRCGGVPVFVASGVPSFVTIVVVLTYLSGFDTVLAKQSAIARIVAAVNALAPGETLHVSTIVAAAIGAGSSSTGIASAQVTTPTGDIAPSSIATVLRTGSTMVTA